MNGVSLDIRRISATYFMSNWIEKGGNILYLYPNQIELLNAEDVVEFLNLTEELSNKKPFPPTHGGQRV